MAVAKDINDFYRGDTQRYTITLTDNTGQPIDITGASIWFTMKSKLSDTDVDAAVQKEVTIHTDAVNGVSEVLIASADTNMISPGTYYYDFQLVDASGNVKTFLSGKVKVKEDVTRSI